MDKSLRNTTIKLKVDVDYKNLKDVDKHLKDTSTEAKKYENALDKTGKAIQEVDKKQEGLSKQYKQAKESVSSLKDQVDKNNKSLVEAEKATDKAIRKNKDLESSNESLGRSVDKQSKRLSDWTNKLAHTSSNLDGLSKKFKDTGKNISDFSRDITSTLGKMTLAGGLAIGYSLKKASDFEQAMKDSQALMSGDEWEQYGNKLSDTVKKLGADTKYSSVETAKGLQELIKAGVNTQDILSGGLKDSLNLATAGELDLAKAAETMSTALNSFTGDTSLTSAKAANLLAGAANASATDVNEMSFALSQSAAVANMVNQSFESTSTALAVLAQNGLKGSDAGTSLKTMLMNLSPQTESAARTMEALGLAQTSVTNGYNYLVKRGLTPATITYDAVVEKLKNLAKVQAGEGATASKIGKEYEKLVKDSGLVSSAFFTQSGKAKDMEQVFGLLQKSLKGLSEEQKINALKTMFGTDAIRAATIASKAGKKGFDDMNSAMQGVTAADVAKEKMNTLKGSIEYATGSIETLVTDVGTGLIPAFNFVAKKVEFVSDKFNGLSKSAKEHIAIGGLIATGAFATVTALGVLGLAVGGLATGYGRILSAGAKLKAWRRGESASLSESTRSIDVETAALSRNTTAQLANARARGKNGDLISSSSGNRPVILDQYGNPLPPSSQSTKSLKNEPISTPFVTNGKNVGKIGKNGLLKTGGTALKGVGKKIPILGTAIGVGALALGGKENLGSNAGSLGGGAAGAAAGAALGSVIPGVGTAIGGLVGGIAGSYFGEKFGASAQKSLEKNKHKVEKSLKDGLKLDGISKGTTSAIKEYEKLNTSATEQLDLLYWSGSKISKDTAKSLKDTYNNMADSIQTSLKTKFSKNSDIINKSMKESGLSDKEQKKIQDKMNKSYSDQEKIVERSRKKINDILQKAAKEHRELTVDERLQIAAQQNSMEKHAIKTMSKSAKEQRTILTELQHDSSRISAKQAADVVKQSKKAKDGAVKEAEKKYKAVIAAADAELYDNHSISKKQHDEIIKNAKETRDKAVREAEIMHTNVVREAKNQASGHLKAVNWETGQTLSKMQQWGRDVSREHESVIKIINNVLKFFGQKTIPLYSTTSAKATVIPQAVKGAYARGTGYHPGGAAVVGEEGPELAYSPYGDARIVGAKGAEIVDLPRGTKVLTASQTRQMMSGGLQGTMPGYANGIGGSIKEAAGNVMNFITDPLKSAKAVYNHFGSLIKHDIGFDGNLGKSIFQKLGSEVGASLKEKFLNTFNIGGASGSIGNISGGASNGVRNYLVAFANNLASKYGLRITSGFRPGSKNELGQPDDHSKGLAIDLAGSYEGMWGAAVEASRSPLVRYVINRNMWSRNGGEFTPYPWGGHNNHTHISARAFKKGGWKNNHDSQVLVGEEGPELVDLPFGSQVHSNRKTNELMKGNGQPVQITFNNTFNFGDVSSGNAGWTESQLRRKFEQWQEETFKQFRMLLDSGVAY